MPARSQNPGGIPLWVWIAGGVAGVAFVYLRGQASTSTGNPTSGASSIANAPNSPMAAIMNMGSNPNQLVTSEGQYVPQGLPTSQLTANEPGTAPLTQTSGGIQYG
jgi:hypothetical protein